MPAQPSSASDSPEKQISRGTVAIYKEYLGRGPGSATTTITETFATTICENGLTKAEQRLVERGEHDVVREIRRKFQLAMSAEMRRLVEGVTSKRTKTLLSDHDVDNDIAIETVIFE